MTRREILDQIGECLNYIAFMDEKDSAFVAHEFGGEEEIVTSVALVQSILGDVYDALEEEGQPSAVICMGYIHAHANGQPQFHVLAYGPFQEDELEQAKKDIRAIEGGGLFVRPLVDLHDTIRRLSAD